MWKIKYFKQFQFKLAFGHTFLIFTTHFYFLLAYILAPAFAFGRFQEIIRVSGLKIIFGNKSVVVIVASQYSMTANWPTAMLLLLLSPSRLYCLHLTKIISQ